jgi:hypothetical protein
MGANVVIFGAVMVEIRFSSALQNSAGCGARVEFENHRFLVHSRSYHFQTALACYYHYFFYSPSVYHGQRRLESIAIAASLWPHGRFDLLFRRRRCRPIQGGCAFLDLL